MRASLQKLLSRRQLAVRESRCWSLMRRLQSTASALSRLTTLPLFHEVLVSGLWKQQEKLLLNRLVCGCTDPGARLHLLLHNCQLPSRLSLAKLYTAHKIP